MMNYLLDNIFYWLKYTTDILTIDCLWMRGDQHQNPNVPQTKNAFGYFKIINAQVMSQGGEKHTYNESEDKIDIEVKNYYEVTVTIDIYSKDQSAVDIAAAITNSIFSVDVTQHFFENNVGFVKFDSITDLSFIVSSQTRKRIQVMAKFNTFGNYEYQVDRIVSAPVIEDIST